MTRNRHFLELTVDPVRVLVFVNVDEGVSAKIDGVGARHEGVDGVPGTSAMAVQGIATARAGLIGNPSDGYLGKTISITIRDFFAKVSLYESPVVEIVPSLQDRSS